MPRQRLLALIATLLASTSFAQEPAKPASAPANAPIVVAKRRIYVTHSGVHTILSDPHKNIAADAIKGGLIKRGIDAKDIVVLENPYPTASWRNMFPVECVTMFGASALPGSRIAQEAYFRMHKALQALGVKGDDDLVWVGHSAGGQMGLTMAYLSKNLAKFPELQKAAQPYRFDMVILLGSPVAANLLAPEIKLRHYFSPQDKVVHWVSRYGPTLLWTFGFRAAINVIPPNLDDNDCIRLFQGVEHPYWDVDTRVVKRIVAETDPKYRPAWRSPLLAPGLEASILRLVAQTVEEACNVSFEDAPWMRR